MSNVISGNPFYIDTEGIISTVPLRIKSIVMKPNATGDAATFTYWVESDSAITNGTKTAATTTVTAATGTFASTGNFPTANVNPNQILKVTHTSSANNIGYWQIATNADNNTITVDIPAAVYGLQIPTLTNDTSKAYHWVIRDPREFAIIRGSGLAGDTSILQMDFGNTGVWVPNLAMHTLSTSAVLYVYLA